MKFLFCGTRKDLEEVLFDVESTVSVQYYLDCLYETNHVPSLNTLIGPVLESAVSDRPSLYFVLKRGAEIRTEFLHGAHQKYKIVYARNMIRFSPSVVFKKGLMLTGVLSEPPDEPDTMELYKLFRGAIKQRFVLVNSVYLGKEAEQLFNLGWKIAPMLCVNNVLDTYSARIYSSRLA